MAAGVYHVSFGIELNLTEPDLGHPGRPGLWEELHGNCPDGVLMCLACRDNDPTCPQWMYVRLRDGRREAVHHKPSIPSHEGPDSDAGKALKERIARAAVDGGFEAVVDDRGAKGRRTGVLIRGSGILLGCEAQLAPIGAKAVNRRSYAAVADGITPLWTTTDRKAQVIDRAPWARVDRLPWHQYLGTADLPVRGGVRGLRMEQCSRIGRVCPDRKAGRRCSGWHTVWEPREVSRFDDLIVRAAAREFVAVKQQISKQKAHYFWVRADELAEIEPFSPADLAHDGLDQVVTVVDVDPQPLDRTCRYGEDTDFRAAPAPVRDDGSLILARVPTLSQPTTFLDWCSPDHFGGSLLACRLCGQGAFMRDSQGRPCHKVCAEAEASLV